MWYNKKSFLQRSAPLFRENGRGRFGKGMDMDKKKGIVLLTVAIVAVLLVGLILGAVFFVRAAGHFYPRRAEALDLREQELTVEDYEAIAEKLPQCYILWNIPFQGGTLSSDAQSLTVTTLSDDDVALLDYATALKTVDGWNCTDYAQLHTLQQRHPDAQVRYHLTIAGVDCDQDTRELTLKKLTQEDGANLSFLPKLEKVAVSGCTDYALLQSLQQEHPGWNLTYTLPLGDQTVAWDSKEVTATGASHEEVAGALEGLPYVEKLHLTTPKATGAELTALREAYPEVAITWEVEIQGQTLSSELEEVDLSYFPAESTKQIQELAAFFPKAQKVIVDNGSVDYETMAALREEMRPQYKLVWTVMCGVGGKRGPIAVRTDETTFMPIKHSVYYFLDPDVVNLKYCEDMECIDVGHMTFTDCSFVANMPHLKYLILAHTSVRDITPLSNCKELKFLELDWSLVIDYSPLVECTSLEDLNLGNLYGDAEPLTKMTWLKNLWWKDCNYTKQQLLREALPNTTLTFNLTYTVGNGWRHLQNYYDMRDMLGMPYME